MWIDKPVQIEQPQMFFTPRVARFVGYRRLPQFVTIRQRGKERKCDCCTIGLWWWTIAWLTPAKYKSVMAAKKKG